MIIRKSEDVKGIKIGDNEHKIIQYADDATICVRDKSSIKHVLEIITDFSKLAGPKLSVRKTKGIWLGPLKELGIRVHENITFTGNPVKCLGIYIGHNKNKCYTYNWTQRIQKISNITEQCKKRNLTLFGRVCCIKTYILSKIVYPASILKVPDEIIKQLKDIIYAYLWKGKRDRVKRTAILNDTSNGGLKMVDLNSFLISLKAAWVPKIISMKGKWADRFSVVLKELKLPRDYIWKLSVRDIKSFPLLKSFPTFYQDVIIALCKAKHIRCFHRLSTHDVFQQPLWGNEYFKIKGTCLYLRNWVKEDVLYVKDLVNDNGGIKNDEELYNMIGNKSNIYQEIYIIKNYVLKRLHDIDTSIAPYVRIRSDPTVIFNNKLQTIVDKKSKFFYMMLISRQTSTPHMETIYAKEFKFVRSKHIWKTIYKQKLCLLKLPKLNEFNFKILHNIVPCGKIVSKWKKNVSDKCEVCGEIETTKHMLYECQRINVVWQEISEYIKCNISWKTIVCGFPMYPISNKIESINFIVTLLSYVIFKENSYCKFNEKSYINVNIKSRIKENIFYYRRVLEDISGNNILYQYMNNITENIH